MRRPSSPPRHYTTSDGVLDLDPRATILIVDDDPSVVSSLALLAKQNGLRSVTADGPESALSALGSERVDLVLQDMNFSRSTSGEEGLALLRRIRQASADVPVILITAWGSIALAVEGMKVGASDFVTKPWDNERLVETLRTALSLFGRSRVDEADREYEISLKSPARRITVRDELLMMVR